MRLSSANAVNKRKNSSVLQCLGFVSERRGRQRLRAEARGWAVDVALVAGSASRISCARVE